jgi:pimeloyl-ACP methyl ester carboxylesterase
MAHSFGGLAVSLALEEISHTPDYRLALIAPATETTTAIDSFFRFLQIDAAVRTEFEKLIIRKAGVSSEWYSIKRAMKHIKAKVLWLHDEGDDVTPLSDALKIKEENYPNIEFVITKGLGHRRIYSDNKVTKAVVDFL